MYISPSSNFEDYKRSCMHLSLFSRKEHRRDHNYFKISPLKAFAFQR